MYFDASASAEFRPAFQSQESAPNRIASRKATLEFSRRYATSFTKRHLFPALKRRAKFI
jgi:hypothetical protein